MTLEAVLLTARAFDLVGALVSPDVLGKTFFLKRRMTQSVDAEIRGRDNPFDFFLTLRALLEMVGTKFLVNLDMHIALVARIFFVFVNVNRHSEFILLPGGVSIKAVGRRMRVFFGDTGGILVLDTLNFEGQQ